MGEQRVAREMLSMGRSLPILYDLARNAEGLTDSLVQHVQSQNVRKVACKAGCSWCCNLRVTVTPPEVLTITSYLQYALSEQEYQIFKNRVEAAANKVYELTADERFFARIPCPLLVDDLCSVYEFRPVRMYRRERCSKKRIVRVDHTVSPRRSTEEENPNLTLRNSRVSQICLR